MKISQAAEQGIMSFKLKKPIYYWGSPGIGKSQMVRQLKDELKISLIDRRFSQMDPTDVVGLPRVEEIDEHFFSAYAQPAFLPRVDRDGPDGILFLDEFGAATQAVQAAGYQLILDRRLGDYKLPDGWMVMAAGNLAEDRAIAIRMSSALGNRFKNCDVEVDLDEWKIHAIKSGFDPVIISLMNSQPSLLHDMSIKTAAWPSPRTWEDLSDHVPLMNETNEFNTAASCVGAAAAGSYVAFKLLEDQLPTREEIEANPTTAHIPSEPSAKFFAAGMLSTGVTEKNFPAYLTYQKRLDIEYQTVFIKDAYNVCPEVADLKEFAAWSLANHNTVL